MSGLPETRRLARGHPPQGNARPGDCSRPLVRLGLTFLVSAALLGSSALLDSCASDESTRITIALALLPSEQQPYRTLLDRFTDSTGVQVTLVSQQYQQIRNAVEAEAIAGRGELDVVELDVHLLGPLRNKMQQLDTLIHAWGIIRNDIAAEAFEPGLDGDGIPVFLPHRLNWQAMVYDREEIPNPPRTWEELLEIARAHPGKIGMKAARYEGMVCDLFPFLWQAGGDPLHPTAPGTLAALRFLQKLAPALNPAAPSYRENSILQAQERKEILLHFNWPFVVPLLREKGLLGTTIGIAPLPAGPAGSATVLGGGYLGIPRTAPHPELAARLVEYLVSADTQDRLARDLGWFPVRESAWEAVDTTGHALQAFLVMKDEVRSRPAQPDYDRLSALWQEAFSRILFEQEQPDRVASALAEQLGEYTGRRP